LSLFSSLDDTINMRTAVLQSRSDQEIEGDTFSLTRPLLQSTGLEWSAKCVRQ